MRLQIKRVTAALRAPFVSASGALGRRELLLLALEDSEGRVGFGEAAPLEAYDGVGIEECHAALEDCRGALTGARGDEREELIAECERLAVLPQAVAAVDLALWDLAGRRARQPIWRLLGAEAPRSVMVNRTITASDRAGAAAEAAGARAAGFETLKLKVGTGDDAGRLAAVRAAAGPEMRIRLDANGAWSPAEARAALRTLEPAGIELCEEPVSGAEQIAALAEETDVPLALDESSANPGALDRRICTAACLKVTRWGGISGLLDAGRRARAAGYELYFASTLDGPLGIAAALHAASMLEPDRACGLATLAMFAERTEPLRAARGIMCAPRGAGLGDGLIDWYES